MKKLILAVAVVLAAVVFVTGCNGGEVPAPSGEAESSNAVYQSIYNDAVAYLPSYDYPTEDGLPMTKKNGSVSLKDRFSEDEERLRPLLEEFVESDLAKRYEISGRILQIICGTEVIPEEDGSFSKRKLTVLRKFWSEDQEGIEEKVPEPNNEDQAAKLDSAYDALIKRYALSLICSLTADDLAYIRKYTDNEGEEYPYLGFFNWHLCNGLELGDMTERRYCDCVMSLVAYGSMRDHSPKLFAEFYAFLDERASVSYASDDAKRCRELAESAARETAEILGGAHNVCYFFGEDSGEYSGNDDTRDLIIGGDGDETFCGRGMDDFLIGGLGDDVYESERGFGCDTIFDCGGHNLIRFEDISSVYAVELPEEDFKNDVKLCFSGGCVIIKNFKSGSAMFDVEIDGKVIAYDDPENPLCDIHEAGYVPDVAKPIA